MTVYMRGQLRLVCETEDELAKMANDCNGAQAPDGSALYAHVDINHDTLTVTFDVDQVI